MRFTILSCVFWPERVVSARTSTDIARALARRGHTVTVVTAFPSRVQGNGAEAARRGWIRREDHPEGFAVVRCNSFVSRRSSMPSRFLENVSFGIVSGLVVLLSGKPDLMYANTWPLFAAGIASTVARIRRIPLVTSIQDIYPESMVSQSRIGAGGVLEKVLRRMDGWTARGSRALVVISDSFKKVYTATRGVNAAAVNVIPNWVAEDGVVADDTAAARLRARFGIAADDFLVVYGGNVGAAAGVETLVAAFGHLKGERRIHCLVAGEGSRLGACRESAHRMGCDRVHFLSPWPEVDTSPVLTAADLLVLPTSGRQSMYSHPSKMASYYLAGRPILALACAGSDIVREMEQSRAGWIVAPEDPRSLADAIRKIESGDPSLRRQRGEMGRAYARSHLTRDVCVPRLVELLEHTACP